MKIARYGLFLVGLVIVIFLAPMATHACPNCFVESDSKVLDTYYLSAVLLSAIPFGIIGSIAGWLLLQKRRTQRRK